MCYGNGDLKAGWSRLEKLEEIQWSIVDIRMPVKLNGRYSKQWSGQQYYKGQETWATTKRQEKRIEVIEMRTHPMNNASEAGFRSDYREKFELIRACDDERWQTHTEESVEGGYTREKEERTTENKMNR